MNKIIVFVGVLMTAVAVQASYLNWQVSTDDLSKAGFSKVDLVSSVALYGVSSGGEATRIAGAPIDYFSSSNIGNYESFYVELLNASNETIGLSVDDNATYANLVSNGMISTDKLSEGAMAVWHPASYAVPEPTSAMMMMLGIAFLGLKRRKA